MAQQKPPSFPFYYRDWLHAVRRWDAADKIEYLEMMFEQADSVTGSIPPEIFNTECHTDRVRDKFEKDANGFFNVRLRDILLKQSRFKESRLENLKGAKPQVAPQVVSQVENEKEKEKKIKKVKPKTDPIKYPWLDELFLSQWELWKRYKKEQYKFTYQPIGEQAALTALKNDSGNDVGQAIAMINFSISKGYKGIFAPKTQPGTNEPTTKRPSRKKL